MLDKGKKLDIHERLFTMIKRWQAPYGRVYILPTSFGLYFIATTFLLFLMSLSYGHSLAFTCTFLFSSLIIVSAHFTNFNLYHLKIKDGVRPGYGILGENEVGHIEVENQSSKVRFDLKVSLPLSSHEFKGQVLGKTKRPVTIKGKDDQVIGLGFSDLQRGCYWLERVKITSSFPFGLFEAWTYHSFSPREYWIFPKPMSDKTIHTKVIEEVKKLKSRDEEYENLSTLFIEGNDSFYEHSLYQEGGNLKRMDWKIYARTHLMYEKKYSEAFTKKISLKRKSLEMILPELEDQLSFLTAQILSFQERHIEFSLVLDDEPQLFGAGYDFVIESLKRLALYKSRESDS